MSIDECHMHARLTRTIPIVRRVLLNTDAAKRVRTAQGRSLIQHLSTEWTHERQLQSLQRILHARRCFQTFWLHTVSKRSGLIVIFPESF